MAPTLSAQYSEAYLKAIKITLKFEGGYFAEEHTNFGIMQGTYDAFRLSKGMPKKDVLDISKDEVYECYYIRYFLRGDCDTLGPAMMTVHLDACVNFGITGANRILGKVLDRCPNATDKEMALIYCDIRMERRYEIVKNNSKKKKFLKGWLRRDKKLKRIITTEY